MSDEVDKASELELIISEQITEKARLINKRQCDRPEFKNWDGCTCINCGEQIPQVRLNYGCVRCVDCQETLEKTNVHPRR